MSILLKKQDILMSIKPEYIDKIFSGEKKVEFRKRAFNHKIRWVFMYSTSPVQRIVGYFEIKEIHKESPERLWRDFENVGGISKRDYWKYFGTKKIGYAIEIMKFIKWESNINPFLMCTQFVPPQSFIYVSGLFVFSFRDEEDDIKDYKDTTSDIQCQKRKRRYRSSYI